MQIAKNLGANGKLVKDQVDAIVGVAAMANRSEAVIAAAAGKAAARGISRLAMAARVPIIGLNVVLLGFSIYDIVDASIELHKKKKSKGGDLLREVVDKLEKIKMNEQTKIWNKNAASVLKQDPSKWKVQKNAVYWDKIQRGNALYQTTRCALS